MLREDLYWVGQTLKEFLPPNGRQGVCPETYYWVYFAEFFSPRGRSCPLWKGN